MRQRCFKSPAHVHKHAKIHLKTGFHLENMTCCKLKVCLTMLTQVL